MVNLNKMKGGKDEKAKVDRDNLTNRLLYNGDGQALNKLDKPPKGASSFPCYDYTKKRSKMSFEFILIAVLAAWVGINEWRLTRLENEVKNLKDKK